LTTDIETPEQAWQRRTATSRGVDFTMMYVGHDALVRDLTRLTAAAEGGTFHEPAALATWELFSRMLHLHHEAEDAALWPPLAAAAAGTSGVGVVEAMEAEHRAIDPLVDAIDVRLVGGDDVTELLDALRTGLAAHLLHEETSALPLLAATLGQDGWAHFVEHFRQRVGMEQLPTVLPWMLEDAPESAAASFLNTLPPAVLAAYSDQWRPAYGALNRLR
jgi:iron-sulfur cluster repair protein YtfE (RIC family)